MLPALKRRSVPAQLKILQVVPAYLPAVRYGGPIRSVHEQSRALVDRGNDVCVFTTNIDGNGNLDVPLDTPVDVDGVAVYYFPVGAFRRLCWSPSLEKRLHCVLSNFDIVHLHSVYLWPTYIAARIARRFDVPYVMSPRGMLVGDIIRRKNRVIKKAWIKCVERRSILEAAAVHVTAAVEAIEIRALGLNPRATYCIPNGVRFPAKHLPLAQGPFSFLKKPYALFLSRLSWKKGLERLIAAWQEVPDLDLMIAGNDEGGYRALLEARVEGAGLKGRIHFLGPVNDEHKWALYEHAEMLVLPSFSENFGNVVAEAMSMACPVVITPEVGLAQLVGEYKAGVVTSGEPIPLARAVRELHGDEVRRRRLGLAGRRAALEKLTWPSVALQMEAMYRQILTDRLPATGP